MATPQQIYDGIQSVHDRKSFVHHLLTGALGWPIPDGIDDIGDISFEWSGDDLQADGLDDRLVDGRVYQIRPLADDQPWGIFLLEFKNDDVFLKNRGLTGPLRKVLRGLVHNRRKSAHLRSWRCDDLLFICTDKHYHNFRFAYFKAPKETEKNAPLSLFGWNHGNTDIRTLCTHNLPYLQWNHDKPDYNKWRQAFDKQRLTEKFFNEYKSVFDIFQKDLAKQTQKSVWAHDYALQFLNRCMFLYFIQQKKWLGDDCEFMKNFWTAYEQSGQPTDTFFDNWLKVLFFEAFNNNYTVRRPYMPDSIHTNLLMAPYLNGGLFKENDLDNPGFDFAVSDIRFRQILDLLDRYNFTVSESTPLEIEVAVDAEMLGMVYETLVNIAEDEDRRGDAGIFYTPRVEVDMMCRLSVVNYLSNRLGTQHRELFYKWLLAFSSDKQRIAERGIAEKGLLEPLRAALESLTVVDPACGSGAFLVGMLMVLDDLFDRLDKLEGKFRSLYSRRKDIIGRSLYGVDIKDWACHVAELRLWLALVIDADFTAEELHIRCEPLLPNFTFNIRCGDSLAQEVGGLDIAHRKGLSDLSSAMKRKLTELKNEKIKFYSNASDAKFKTVDMLKHQEVLIFRQLLDDRIAQIDGQAKELMRIQAAKKADTGRQRNLLTGELEGPSKQLQLDIDQREQQIVSLMEEKQRLEQLTRTLHNQANIPFVWDISFAEIFQTDKQGFDIVIGNPPYVRQEKIADPRLKPDHVTTDNKKAYKEKLQRLVYRAWQKWFDYKEGTGKATRTLDAKSDLYIYFFFYGLSLLNDRGSFCFITSNSWLDVGYGADLQEFLLNCCPVRMIIDNKAMRSFKSADVNTAIALFGAPSPRPDASALSHTARFVMFYVPFEQVLDDVVFTLIEAVEHRTKTEQFRVFPIKQEKLFENGCEIDEQITERKNKAPLVKTSKKYIGNIWGGVYLRAPDIYWEIFEKAGDKLVNLNSIAQVKFGIKSGSNDFFYLTKQQAEEIGIEEDYLKPLIKTPRDCPSIHIKSEHLNTVAFWCQKSKKELSGTNALKYIKWGEEQGYSKLPSVQGRQYWYELPNVQSNILWWKSVGERYCCFWNPKNYFADQRNYPIVCEDDLVLPLLLSLNCTFDRLFLEVGAREMTGAYTIIELSVQAVQRKLTIQPRVLRKDPQWSHISKIFKEMMERPILNLDLELQQKDRQEIDQCVAEIIGLKKNHVDKVYKTLMELVYGRLQKSTSIG